MPIPRWNPDLHPRDRHGRFIDVAGWVSWLLPDGERKRGQVTSIEQVRGRTMLRVHERSGAEHMVLPGNVDVDETPKASLNQDVGSETRAAARRLTEDDWKELLDRQNARTLDPARTAAAEAKIRDLMVGSNWEFRSERSVDLSGLYAEDAEQIADELERLHDRYPETFRRRFSGIVNDHNLSPGGAGTDDATAMTTSFRATGPRGKVVGGMISLEKTMWKAQYDKPLSWESPTAGGPLHRDIVHRNSVLENVTVDDSIAGIIDHEFGHLVSLDARMVDDPDGAWNMPGMYVDVDLTLPRSERPTTSVPGGGMGEGYHNDMGVISKYGDPRVNGGLRDEEFAESFAAYELGRLGSAQKAWLNTPYEGLNTSQVARRRMWVENVLDVIGRDDRHEYGEPKGTLTPDLGNEDLAVLGEVVSSRFPGAPLRQVTFVDDLVTDAHHFAGKDRDSIRIDSSAKDPEVVKAREKEFAGVMVDSSLLGTVTHEYGHILDGLLLEQRPDQAAQLDAYVNEPITGEDWQGTEFTAPRWQSSLADPPSAYASESRYEYVAESFTDFMTNGDEAKPSSKAIGAIFESAFGESINAKAALIVEPDQDYRGAHQPSQGPPAFDLTADGQEDWSMPADLYDHPDWYVGDPGSTSSRETIGVLRSIRGNPDAMVTIYRGAPPGSDGINPGDWVTLSKTYATEHGYDAVDPSLDWPVYELQVPASEVLFAGDDLNEFGWWPDETGTESDLSLRNPDRVTYTSDPGLITATQHGSEIGELRYHMLDDTIVVDDVMTAPDAPPERDTYMGFEMVKHLRKVEGRDKHLTTHQFVPGDEVGTASDIVALAPDEQREMVIDAKTARFADAYAQAKIVYGEDGPFKQPAILSMDETKAVIADRFKEHAKGPVVIRVFHDDAYEGVAEHKAIANQFVTKKSMGAYVPEERGNFEEATWGTDERGRIVYGYIFDPDNPKQASWYGDAIFVLKPEVADRTTVTIGDSLSSVVAPIPLTQIDEATPDEVLASSTANASPSSMIYDAANGNRWTPDYIEAQVQGEPVPNRSVGGTVPLDWVDHIEFDQPNYENVPGGIWESDFRYLQQAFPDIPVVWHDGKTIQPYMQTDEVGTSSAIKPVDPILVLAPSHRVGTTELIPSIADTKVKKPAAPRELTDEGLPDAVKEKERNTWESLSGVTLEEAASNLRDVFTDAVANDPAAVKSGREWYQIEHDDIVVATVANGYPEDVGYAVTAAISPGLRWPENRAAAVRIMEGARANPNMSPEDLAHKLKEEGGWGLPYGWEPLFVATRIAQGADIDTSLTGVKRRSFFNSLKNPDNPHDVTIDSHMLDAAKGGLTPGPAGVFIDTPKAKVMDRMYQLLGWTKTTVNGKKVWTPPEGHENTPPPVLPKGWTAQVPEGAEYTANGNLSPLLGSPKYAGHAVGVVPYMADAVRDIAEEWNITHPDDPLAPLQVQAIIWEHQISLHPPIESRGATNGALDATAAYYVGMM